jgi:hypothetical protein
MKYKRVLTFLVSVSLSRIKQNSLLEGQYKRFMQEHILW